MPVKIQIGHQEILGDHTIEILLTTSPYKRIRLDGYPNTFPICHEGFLDIIKGEVVESNEERIIIQG